MKRKSTRAREPHAKRACVLSADTENEPTHSVHGYPTTPTMQRKTLRRTCFTTGVTPSPKRVNQRAFRYRYRKQEQIRAIVVPKAALPKQTQNKGSDCAAAAAAAAAAANADGSAAERQQEDVATARIYDRILRPHAEHTPSKLMLHTTGATSTTPNKRHYQQAPHHLPSGNYLGSPVNTALLQLLERKAASSVSKAKPVRVDIRDGAQVRQRLPKAPPNGVKLTVFKIDCRQAPKKTRNLKTKPNRQVWNYLSPNNCLSRETYAKATGRTHVPALEFTHLSANHNRTLHCKVLAGDVDPHHPDSPNNMVIAPKVVNSQMMAAELVVDALFQHIHRAHRAHTLTDVPTTASAWQNIKTSNNVFNKAFNQGARQSKKHEVVVGIFATLQTDDQHLPTHNARTIELHIAWNNKHIHYQFDVDRLHTPSLSALALQRELLAPFFEHHFNSDSAASAAASLGCTG